MSEIHIDDTYLNRFGHFWALLEKKKKNQTYKKIYYPLNDIQPTRNLAAGDGDQ